MPILNQNDFAHSECGGWHCHGDGGRKHLQNSYTYQIIMAQWLELWLATGEVPNPSKGDNFYSECKGIIYSNLNCDMVYTIHAQRLVQVEHTHPYRLLLKFMFKFSKLLGLS